MHTRRHSRPSDRHADRLGSDRYAVLVVLLATAAMLALDGLAIVGVLNVIAWLVAP